MLLTADQIKAVQSSWKLLDATDDAKMTDAGEIVLHRYFEKYPHNQQKFPSFKNVPLGELKGSPRFRMHGLRVMTYINGAVECLLKDDAETFLKDAWTEVGKSHAKRKIPRESFKELEEVIVSILAEACNLDQSATECWAALFEYIYVIVFEQYPATNN